MRYSLESIRQVERDLETLSVSRAIRRGLRHLRESGDRLTGGGLRRLGKRQLTRLRDAGDRLTGGGSRALGKRVLTGLLRRAMSQPPLKAIGSGVLQPFPRLSQRLYRLATASDTVPTTSDIANAASLDPAQVKDCSLLVHSLYKAAFRRLADPEGLATRIQQLQSGVSLHALAEELVASAEFQARHGLSQKVDTKCLTALYRDGLGRQPDPEGLAHWLLQGNNGATWAKVLAAFASSNEALQKVVASANPSLLVNVLYKAAFGRLADPEGLANRIRQLQSGVSLQALAEELVASAEFQAQHGLSQKVDTEYLTALYRDGPERQPDAEGLAHWLTEGEKGATRAKALAAFCCSNEAIAKVASLFVCSLYYTAFGRNADEGGLADCVKQLQSGSPLAILAEGVVVSAEFQTRHGPSQKVDAEFLTALYRDGLGREPDPKGLAHWLLEGDNGATRAKVLAAFAGSTEALQKVVASVNLSRIGDPSLLVNALYKAAFGRLADPEGLANRIRQLQLGASLQDLAEALVASAEFEARHGLSREVDVKYVSAVYRDGLGRPPKLEDLAFWLARGREGATRAKALAAVAGSDEASARALLPSTESGMDYNRWVEAFDTITDADRAVIRAHISALPFRPTISLIMPVDAISEVALRESLNSVVTQLYPYWELCIAIDTPLENSLNTIIRDAAGSDLRIRLTEQSAPGGIAGAADEGLKSATGEFVTFLRPGDRLAEHALYEVAVILGGNGGPEIVYTDLDHINSAGQRHTPWFKPGWDPDLLLAQDYFNHLAVYHRALVEAVGGLRPGFEGAEFHELALRTTAATSSNRISHVPAILYHKREENRGIDSKGTIDSKGAIVDLRAVDASRRAVRDHLHSRGDTDTLINAAPQIPTAIRVVWPLPKPEPLVSIIVPTHDRAELLDQCVEGLLQRTDYSNFELLMVDNGSSEPATLKLFDRLTSEHGHVRILHLPGPFNYSALNNAAARKAKGEVLLLLNNDIGVIESNWLREMVSQVLRPDVGVVGAKLLYINGQVQHGGIVLGPEGAVVHVQRQANRNNPGYFGQLALARTLSAVTGACIAVRRAVFFEVGGLDEVNLPLNFNDVDFCLRVAGYGYRVVWTPYAELFHLESASRGRDDSDPIRRAQYLRERRHFCKTWRSLVDSADPFHNPNLLFAWERFEMPAWPRRRKPWHDLGEEMLNLQRHFSRTPNSSNDTRHLIHDAK